MAVSMGKMRDCGDKSRDTKQTNNHGDYPGTHLANCRIF